MKRTTMVVATLTVAAALLLSFVGCGGGGSAAGQTGSIGITVIFPEAATADKDMPSVTQSVKVAAEAWGTSDPAADKQGMLWSDQVIINAGGQCSHQWDNVPVGNVKVTATCYDQNDAAGNLVAEASQIVQVNANATTDVGLVTDRLAEHVRIIAVPAPPGTPPAELPHVAMEPGDSVDIQVKGYDYDGTETAYVDFGWSKDEKALLSMVPTVGSITTLTAVEDGQFTVTATDAKSGEQDSVDVDVISRIAASVEVDPDGMTLYRFGSPETGQITAVARDGLGAAIPYATIGYESSDDSVATVSGTGVVTAQGPGTCTVTVSASSATTSTPPTATCDVTVYDTGGLNVIVQ
jgi:hypothetical protein